MKFCRHCGKEIQEEAVICVHCGCSTAASTPVREDKISVGMCILSFLIPLVGIIYWPVKHKTTPKRARACGICGVIGWVVNFIIIMATGM